LGDEEGMLTLSMVHSASGLEWSTVFISYSVEYRQEQRQRG